MGHDAELVDQFVDSVFHHAAASKNDEKLKRLSSMASSLLTENSREITSHSTVHDHMHQNHKVCLLRRKKNSDQPEIFSKSQTQLFFFPEAWVDTGLMPEVSSITTTPICSSGLTRRIK